VLLELNHCHGKGKDMKNFQTIIAGIFFSAIGMTLLVPQVFAFARNESLYTVKETGWWLWKSWVPSTPATQDSMMLLVGALCLIAGAFVLGVGYRFFPLVANNELVIIPAPKKKAKVPAVAAMNNTEAPIHAEEYAGQQG
jgi:hypothetical protein